MTKLTQSRQFTRNIIVAILFVVAVCGAATAWLTFRSYGVAAEQSRIKERHNENRNDFLLLLNATLSAETGQRGYVITGIAEFKQPYTQAAPVIGGRYARLMEQVQKVAKDEGRDPETNAQLKRLKDIDILVKAKLGEMDTVITVRDRDGLQAAINRVRSRIGKIQMDGIRALVSESLKYEDLRIDQAEQKVEAAFGAARSWSIGLLVAVVLLLGIAALIVQFDDAMNMLDQSVLYRRRKNDMGQ